MYIFLLIILFILSILLIVAVMLQPGKGGGLTGDTFGGLGGQFGSMFGVRRTVDFLQKFTIGLAIAILVLSVMTNKFFLETTTAERAPVTVGADKPPAPTQLPVPQPGGTPPAATPPAGGEPQPGGQ